MHTSRMNVAELTRESDHRQGLPLRHKWWFLPLDPRSGRRDAQHDEHGVFCRDQPLVRENPRVKVVLFSGGRGSRVLATQLIHNPRVRLTVAINGYDNGASTGEVRRFLGDSLGPSDIEKMPHGLLVNCTHVALHLLNYSI